MGSLAVAGVLVICVLLGGASVVCVGVARVFAVREDGDWYHGRPPGRR
jgi:hypothetical protein